MNKAKAIDLLKMAVPIKALTQQEYAEFIEAVNMAIKALESEPCKDAVSRKYLLAEYDRQHEGEPGNARKIIENAPSVMPKPRTGRWEDISPEYHTGMGIVYRCNTCKEYFTTSPREMHYCPNCGAKMGRR